MTPDMPSGLDWLKKWDQYAPEKIALRSGEGNQIFTYAELYRRARRLAGTLGDRFGIGRGDRVAAIVGNEMDYVSLFFATQRLGAILVPVNFRLAPPEIHQLLRDCGAKLVVREAAYAEVVPLDFAVWDFGEVIAAASTGPVANNGFDARFEDPCMILYTSGTTGFPKGAILSHRMLFWNSVNTGLRLNLTQSDVVLTFLPLFHTGGWNVLTTPCLHRGAEVVLLKKFDPEMILRWIPRARVSVLFGVPTTLDFLSRQAEFANTDVSSVRYAIVGGEPMPIELIEIFERRGIPVRQGYGLTEFGPNVFSLNEEDSRRKMGSIGFPNFYVEARVVDDARADVAVGEVGELVLRGPAAMSGYWNQAEATAEILRDGWLHTGDLVRRDDEGFYFVVGRKKEMFISGGENVYPAEVEKALRSLPGVREAAVIGVPHPRWGECGKAFVAFEEGRSLSVEDMREFLLGQLAKFKVPAQFVIVDDLPKTESGKIVKSRLKV